MTSVKRLIGAQATLAGTPYSAGQTTVHRLRLPEASAFRLDLKPALGLQQILEPRQKVSASASQPQSSCPRRPARRFLDCGQTDDQVRILIGHQHPFLGRIEHEIARRFASAIGASHRRQSARFEVGAEAIEKIIASIGEVNGPSVLRDHRVAGAADTGRIGGQQIDACNQRETSVGLPISCRARNDPP